MNRTERIIALSSLVFVLTLTLAPASFAATELISPIPGFGQAAGKDLGSYINAIFTYGIGLAALIAMAQLVFGAFQYTASAGAPSLQEDAKSRMRSAVVGVILLLTSTLILVSLDKDFGSRSLNLPPPAPAARPGESPEARRERELNTLAVDALEAADRLKEKYNVFGQDGIYQFLGQNHLHWYRKENLDGDLQDTNNLINRTLAGIEDPDERAAAQRDFDVAFKYVLERAVRNDYFQDETGTVTGAAGSSRWRYGTTAEEFREMIDMRVDGRYHPTIYK